MTSCAYLYSNQQLAEGPAHKPCRLHPDCSGTFQPGGRLAADAEHTAPRRGRETLSEAGRAGDSSVGRPASAFAAECDRRVIYSLSRRSVLRFSPCQSLFAPFKCPSWRRRNGALMAALVIITLVGILPNRAAGETPADAALFEYEQETPYRPSARKSYVNQWAVQIHEGGDQMAEQIAKKYGFKNLGKIMDNYYLFASMSPRIRKRSTRRTRDVTAKMLGRDFEVDWLEQQVAKRRVKRGYGAAEHRLRHRNQRQAHEHWISHYQPQQPVGNGLFDVTGGGDDDSLHTATAVDQHVPYGRRRDHAEHIQSITTPAVKPNDAYWPYMWYLHRPGSGLDHNVKEAWDLGYTGKGIVVTILDDGLERTHPDIKNNYDALASFDVNDHDDDPTPRYDDDMQNRHGTRCAGEVAAVYNNSICIVGIAFDSKIGGIRMLDGDVTDAVEAASLSHNRHHIDIYSASWGPDDDGRTLDGPARLARLAFEHGIRQGRRGLGSIFVWASGNGGRDGDSCNCDGYTNSIYTLSISSATEHGQVPWYSEACSSTMATTFSSGGQREQMIITTDLRHSCTRAHSGTSASAPLAAAISALTLEANTGLTWRDLQHIVVRTAKPRGLKTADWHTNGVGRNVSHSFGFGLMDAGAMVKLAKNWTNVPPSKKCVVGWPGRYRLIPHGARLKIEMTTDGCSDSSSRVNFLEHVVARVTLTAPKRGDIAMFLTSPSGTRTQLLQKRARDVSRAGFRDWGLMTVHFWGETAAGTWKLEIDNDGWDDANLLQWDLTLHGTAEPTGPYGGYEKPQADYILKMYGLSAGSQVVTSAASTLLLLLVAVLCTRV